jgi:tryptophan halogenase
MGNGHVYSSGHIGDDEAERVLLANIEGQTTSEPRRLRFITGRRRECWSRNVVSMGLSSGFVEPLESTSIHMIQSGIAKLIALFPDKRFNPVERKEYNRQMRELYEDVRDFIVLHYNATKRTDSEFWNQVKTMSIPDSLSEKLELFRAKARLFRDGFELFATPSWVAVCLGQHVTPETYEPAVDALDEDKISVALEQMRLAYLEAVRRLPTHAEFIAGCCSAQVQPWTFFNFAPDAVA